MVRSLIIIPILLTIFGIFMIFESSSVNAARVYSDAFFFIKHQIIWFLIALVAFSIFYFIDYHLLYNFSLLLLVINLVLLMLIFIPGMSTTVLGAKRWLKIGPIPIQPSEFTKLTLITYLSSWFSYRERSRFFAFLLLTSIIIGLVMLQPDLGTATILGATAIFLYFVSSAPLSNFLILIPLGLLTIGIFAFLEPYRIQRMLTFINPELDPQGIGYHVRQINIALSLGGLWGVGFGHSKQKFQFLPEAHTDSIFAIIGENFGFLGTSIVVFCYLILLINAYQQIIKIKNKLGFLLASGIVFLIITQSIINLGGMVQILPLTGVPLPFISYGGSSLVTFYALLGIMLNIFKQERLK